MKEKIDSFEKKHGCNLRAFEDRIKQLPEDFELWDDFIEWKAYADSLKELESEIRIEMQPTSESFQDTLIKSVMNFKVVLQQAEEGGYIVSCPALPGCHSQGDSMEEALENIKEAIAGCLESLAEERT